ncbi:hypothetical protein D9619_013757 [Psilocybe cf. subviscida]|uniref:Chromo domain-containing protein n=1 Tax=Psilocybe cf. subviscida TaxID=2480587 RepID=A0A8H5BH26_9AGAR|nr:hypothetical protein D9619_013757 [Psilocybe cf. subviscida]
MEVKLPSLEDDEGSDDSIPLGTFTDGLVPKPPDEGDFVYSVNETLHDLKPTYNTLHAPEIPEIRPPPGRYFPTPPDGGYQLMRTQAYTRGFVYVADYDLGSMETHKNRLIHIATPPLTLLNGRVVVPGMIRMEPGIPFVFRFNKEAHRLHTVGCLQTLESLKHYPDYPQILDASVQLAKLSWGYSSDDGSASVPPVYELDGLKPNDRSTTRPFQDDTRDGSYSLGHTVMKGDGLGTVLPSVQANSSQAVSQISAILKTLHTLRRLVMPKCLSRFENEIWDFHMDLNNVFSFGGLEPNGSSVQLNVSSLGVNLNKAIGAVQGFWHADFLDDPQFWTLFILLLRIGPGPFFLARGGIYVHELGAWVIFLVFKGTDLHTGVAPHEDTQSHAAWVKSVIDSVWNLVGPQNRLGFVIYLGCVPSKRLGSANVTPPTGFGNYGSSVAHKATQKDFASHGHATMGSRDDRANRLGREAVSDFYNTLRHSHLSLNIDINKLMECISYQDHGVNISLRPLPYHPIQDREHIKKYLSLYAWHSSESNLFNLGITNKMLRSVEPTDLSAALMPFDDATELVLGLECLSLPIEEVLSQRVVAGRPVFTVRLENDNQVYNIAQDHHCVVQNKLIQSWIRKQLNSQHRPIQVTLPNRITRARARLLADTSAMPASLSDGSPESTATTENVEQNITPISPMQVDTPALTIDVLGSARPGISRPQRTNTRKRKYNADDEIDEDGTSSYSDDNNLTEDDGPSLANVRSNVYEVEAIVGHRNFDDRTCREWLVKFKGYDNPEYVKENDLSGCLRLLSQYNRKHGLENLHLARSVVTKVPRKDVVAPRVNAVSELAANLNQFLLLLDERRLDAEIAGMIQRFQNAINGGKDHWSTDTTISSFATIWTDHCNATYDLSDCLPFFESSPIDTTIIQFGLMQRMMSVLPRINSSLHQLDVVERGFQQELCRALISIYNWYTTTGPLLSQHLLSYYQSSGFEELKTKSSPLAHLVDHVVQYTHSRIVEMRNEQEMQPKKGRKRLGKKHKIMVAFNQLPQSRFYQKIAAESLNHVPGNLYGLLESPKVREYVKLPLIARGRLPIVYDPMSALVSASAACLEELWSREIVMPAIKSLESHSAFKSSRSTSADLSVIRDRAITRGAILSCIRQACQSDGIFASTEMKTFLSRPTQDLLPLDRDSRRAGKLQGPDRDEYLQPLREAIEDQLDRYPGIVEKAARLGDLMETHLYAVHTGGVVDFDDFLPVGDENLAEDLDPTSVTRTKKTG